MLMFKCFVKADLRQKSLLFWDWIFPFVLMVAAAFFVGESNVAGQVLGGLMAFLVMQTMIFGIPYRISEYTEQGVLRLISEEGSAGKFLFGFIATRTLMAMIQCLIFLPIGALIMGVNLRFNWAGVAIALITGLVVLGGLALLIASICKKQQMAFGLSQMVYMILAVTSGIFYPLENSPQILQAVSQVSPLTYISQLFGYAIKGNGTNYMNAIILIIAGLVLSIIGLAVINSRLNKRHLTTTTN